jgi:hypothetical protein
MKVASSVLIPVENFRPVVGQFSISTPMGYLPCAHFAPTPEGCARRPAASVQNCSPAPGHCFALLNDGENRLKPAQLLMCGSSYKTTSSRELWTSRWPPS